MRKTKRYTLGLVLCACWLPGTTLHAQDQAQAHASDDLTKVKLHIYLLIGQSNMAGRARYTDEDSSPIERCYLLNDEDKWESAKNPLNRHSTIRKELRMQRMNPGYSFSKAMLEMDQGSTIGLVVNAKGGTKIEEWEKGTHFYEEAVRRANEARKTGTLEGILWHQGEGNSYDDPKIYLDKLNKLIVDLRKDLKQPNLPFVIGQLSNDKEHRIPLNNAFLKVPDLVPFTGCAISDGLMTTDNTHFDNKGMKLLGQRYAEEMLKIQTKKSAEQP